MIMATSTNKQRFFERLSLNFKYVKEAFQNLKVSPDVPGMVPCPLCFRIFAVNPDELTLEHAPPSKLGGKITALTCRRCNNEQGSVLESKLIEYYRIQESLTGDSQRRADATAQFDDLPPVQVGFSITGNNLHIVPISKASNPKALEAISRSFGQGAGPRRFTLHFKQPGQRSVRIALIRSAYLIAFGQFGYGFAVNPGLDYIRNLFTTPNDKSLYPHGVIFGFKCPDDFLGVSIITQPMDMRAYLVAFDLFDGDRRIDRIGVVLPGWTNDPTALYSYLDSIDGQEISMSFARISSDLDFIVEAPLAALQLWNDRFARDDSSQT